MPPELAVDEHDARLHALRQKLPVGDKGLHQLIAETRVLGIITTVAQEEAVEFRECRAVRLTSDSPGEQVIVQLSGAVFLACKDLEALLRVGAGRTAVDAEADTL